MASDTPLAASANTDVTLPIAPHTLHTSTKDNPMKRYSNHGINGMKPDDDGRWVDIDDYRALSDKLDALINAADEAATTLSSALKQAIKE